MNEDVLDLLRSFTNADVQFLVVGVYAIAVHGHARATADLDVWVERSPENARRTYRALEAFGAPRSSVDITCFTQSHTPVHFPIGLLLCWVLLSGAADAEPVPFAWSGGELASCQLTRESWYGPDEIGADGEPRGDPGWVVRYDHDEAGHRIRKETDYLGGGPEGNHPDGEAETLVTYSYERDRRVARRVYGDGDTEQRPDQLYTYRYDDEGRLVWRDYTFLGDRSEEADAEESPDKRVRYLYDGKGRVDRREFHRNDDGHPERVATISYDDEGRRIREKLDTGAQVDDDVERVVTYQYDEESHRVREVIDGTLDASPMPGKVDGDPEGVVTWEYDPEDDEVVASTDGLFAGERDGSVDRVRRYEYDCP